MLVWHNVTWHPTNTWGWLDDVIHEVTSRSVQDNATLQVYTAATQRLLLEQDTEIVRDAVQQVYDHSRTGAVPITADTAAE